jgi:prepilin-type N-terminal cleavage/methylation domain-containing protein
MKQLDNKKGFTLIEVVLVLAIGGLIFLLAFIAFQQVSTNRRDTQRRADAGRVLAELQNYKTDNNKYPQSLVMGAGYGPWSSGTTPADNDTKIFFNSYMKGTEFKSPSGAPYGILANNSASTLNTFINGASASDVYRGAVIFYGINTKCNGNVLADEVGSIAVAVSLEKGVACRDTKG